MVEHSLCMRGARGSIPRTSIFFFFSILYHIPTIYYPYIHLSKKRFKKRQRQGSNLRSQRETAQQATALTTRPRCLILYYTDTPTIPIFPYPHTRLKTFLKKRQWQDLNLRIQRIIDFKSIALDHSATLSSTLLLPICLLVRYGRQIPTYILTRILSLIDRYLMPTHMPSLFYSLPSTASSTLTRSLFSNLQQYSWLVSSPVT